MKMFEITHHLRVYQATLRVHVAGSTVFVRTDVRADGITQAKALLAHVFGAGNVLNVT